MPAIGSATLKSVACLQLRAAVQHRILARRLHVRLRRDQLHADRKHFSFITVGAAALLRDAGEITTAFARRPGNTMASSGSWSPHTF